jgi:hypothetical protein
MRAEFNAKTPSAKTQSPKNRPIAAEIISHIKQLDDENFSRRILFPLRLRTFAPLR